MLYKLRCHNIKIFNFFQLGLGLVFEFEKGLKNWEVEGWCNVHVRNDLKFLNFDLNFDDDLLDDDEIFKL